MRTLNLWYYQVPLPPSPKYQGVTKTSSSKYVIDAVGAMENIIKSSKSMNIWASKGKMWKTFYVSCHGILVLYASGRVIKHDFYNLMGVDIYCVLLTEIRKVFLFLVFPSLYLDYWIRIRIYEWIWIRCISWFKLGEITEKVISQFKSFQIHTRHFQSSKKDCFSCWYVNL